MSLLNNGLSKDGALVEGVTNATKPEAALEKTKEGGFLDNVPGLSKPDYESAGSRTWYYPTTLPSNPNRPQIKFSCVNRSPEKNGTVLTDRASVYFPCPANITFADQGNYSTMELGILQQGVLNKDTDLSQAMGAASKNFLMSAAKTAGAGKAIETVLFGNKVVQNPFQNTSFSGNQIRNFTFNFKMIAKNRVDADQIRQIHKLFREKIYAEKPRAELTAFLRYPPLWEIDFIKGYTAGSFKKNEFLPTINLCYLTAFNTTFNTTAPAWGPGGTPIEVDVSMTFQESRVNERGDIKALDGDSFSQFQNGANDAAQLQAARQYNRGTGGIESYGPTIDNDLN